MHPLPMQQKRPLYVLLTQKPIDQDLKPFTPNRNRKAVVAAFSDKKHGR